MLDETITRHQAIVPKPKKKKKKKDWPVKRKKKRKLANIVDNKSSTTHVYSSNKTGYGSKHITLPSSTTSLKNQHPTNDAGD